MNGFLKALRAQRWDDHRYYHHSRINQTLHLLSALSFVAAYIWMFHDPVLAAFIGWGLAMTLRQAGHFFFEPRTFDHVNRVTHEYKEAVKIGYNLRRKVVLMILWGLAPVGLLIDPTLWGLVAPAPDAVAYLRQLGWLWLLLGVGGIVFRTLQLFIIRDVQTGMVWFAKILTDPFHDIKLYYRAPVHLFHGELIDPTIGVHRR